MPIDYKLYPTCWPIIRRVLLIMADNRCESCRVPNHVNIIRNPSRPVEYTIITEDMSTYGETLALENHVVSIVLTIAHINHDINDNRFKNLRCLCQRCHNVLDAQDRAKHRSITYAKKRYEGILPLPIVWH